MPDSTAIESAALKNGWQASAPLPQERWYHVAYQRGGERLIVRYTKTGRISVAHHTNGLGVIFEPKRNKLAEILATLEDKA